MLTWLYPIIFHNSNNLYDTIKIKKGETEMNDITYCVSKNCKNKNNCQRHVDNNDLTCMIYSVSDFTPKGDYCEFRLEKVEARKDKAISKCEHCGAKLSGESKVGHLGLKYITCPVCGQDSYSEDLGEIELNSDNLRFPQHYFDYNNGKEVTSEWINEQVKECLKYLDANPSEDFVEGGTGNTNVCVTKYDGDDEYRVVVSKGYYETYIPIKN